MIDKTKTYRTRDGREVRIYATDGNGERPIHGAVLSEMGWTCFTWMGDGKYTGDGFGTHSRDLIEVKPRIKREVWVNVYPTDFTIHRDKQAADYMCGNSSRIACVRLTIDVEEGEGL